MLTSTHLESILPQQAAPRVGQKPRHTLLGRALEAFQTGQSARGCAALRRLTPTKHTAGPLGLRRGMNTNERIANAQSKSFPSLRSVKHMLSPHNPH